MYYNNYLIKEAIPSKQLRSKDMARKPAKEPTFCHNTQYIYLYTSAPCKNADKQGAIKQLIDLAVATDKQHCR